VFSQQLFAMKLMISSGQIDLCGLRHVRALQFSNSEIWANDKNPEDYEEKGNTPGQVVL
jgi:hypothetical protein